MANMKLFSWLMFLIITLASFSTRFGISASPVIKTESPPKPHELTSSKASEPTAASLEVGSPASEMIATKPTKQLRALAADKLKRGLTNFMNHLNPAPYFVPTQLSSGASSNAAAAAAANNNNGNNNNSKLALGAQAEPSTIINDGPSADALIKGPNRLVQARPLGGPLRWGRR